MLSSAGQALMQVQDPKAPASSSSSQEPASWCWSLSLPTRASCRRRGASKLPTCSLRAAKRPFASTQDPSPNPC